MNRKFIFSVLASLLTIEGGINAQTPIVVAESTLKVGIMSEEVFYYGFAAGDQLLFTFEEANGKELKEVEIVEMPSSSRFMEFKTKKIEKNLSVTKTGIYKFRFANAGIAARLCKYKIQRIPAGAATQVFDCNVYWRNGYDTTYTNDMEEFLSSADTVINNFQERPAKVSPASSAPANKACFNFILPENTVSWSYYLSVDGEGQKAYDDAAKKFSVSTDYLVSKFPRHSPLLALALGHEAYLSKTAAGPTIDYWIMEGDNSNLFLNSQQFRYMKKGKANNDYSKMDVRKGTLNFCFTNNNQTEALTVNVKITAVQVNQFIDTRPVKRMHVVPKKEMYLKN
jgi:hypothetical protein